MKKIAIRNVRLCTKDCLCLFVCPTGATDTENGVIDVDKCTGCGDCADACSSSAISMVPLQYPPQQVKDPAVAARMKALSSSKAHQEKVSSQIADTTDDPALRQLADAFARANRVMSDDLIRESGYMLPQSTNAHVLLKSLIDDPPFDDFPEEVAHRLLDTIPRND